MRKQCVPGASPFLRAPGTRLETIVSHAWRALNGSTCHIALDYNMTETGKNELS